MKSIRSWFLLGLGFGSYLYIGIIGPVADMARWDIAPMLEYGFCVMCMCPIFAALLAKKQGT